MKTYKCFAAGLAALVLTMGLCGCSSSSSDESSSYVDQVEVTATDAIDAIPEGSETELEWLSYFDLNPTSTAEEKRVDVDLFEQKGGTIVYSQTTSTTKYDQLASRLISNDPPDLFWFEQKMTFPAYCVKGMFQPVDSIVDFDDDMWVGMKDLADQFTLGGDHYVAPINLGVLSVLTYDKDVIEADGLEDPYDIYMNGDWTWDEWYDLMEQYVAGSTDDEIRYGINGWFGAFIFQSTGKTLIEYDAETDEYVSNIDDPDFDRASTVLYNIKKNGLYYSDWIGSASEAFKKHILFYAMGTWAVTPNEGDN